MGTYQPRHKVSDTEAQNQIDIIIGQREITLADGREITVHAYSFMDSLKVVKIAGPLMRGLEGFYRRLQADEDFSLAELQVIFAEDPDAMLQLLAYCCDMTEAEIAELSDEDGSLLLWTWWNVNADFFTRRLVQESGARAAVKMARAQAKLKGNGKDRPDSSPA